MTYTCPICGTYVSTNTAGEYFCYRCGWTSNSEQSETTSYFNQVPCKYCGNNPANGGNGICFCTLGLTEIRS